ncbi:MAG: D-alanine--D-alanine ligase [Myxococcota bacterium]|nr:D-alanine--D-alanine ligase [Myxococcota bacterium]
MDKSTRVGVLMGGMSTERPVSLKSGKAVLQALREKGWNAVGIDAGPDLPVRLREEGVEVAWIALHGQFGEDGCVQGLLEIMRIPYTGSSASSSAAAMDKITTKRLLAGTGIPMPADHTWRRGEPLPEGLVYPLVAKTPEGGSTLGIQICQTPEALEAALQEIGGMGDEVLLEDFVDGREITVAVLEGEALPVVEIVPESGFFDFEAKYTEGRTSYLVPAPLEEGVAVAAQRFAEISYEKMGLAGIARADFIVTADGTPMFLEVNTIPGMTATSLSPMAAAETGVPFAELVERLLLGARLFLEDRGSSPDFP